MTLESITLVLQVCDALSGTYAAAARWLKRVGIAPGDGQKAYVSRVTVAVGSSP